MSLIGQVIDNAMRAIERENDALKDVLPEKLRAPRARQAALGRGRRPVHQHSDVRRRKRERPPRSRLRVLPLPVRINSRARTPESLQHAFVHRPHAPSRLSSRSTAVCTTSLLRIRWNVRPIRRFRETPWWQCRSRHHGVRSRRVTHTWKLAEDEPGHPGHRSRLGQRPHVQRRPA